jgi:dTDP-4-amino-4,6-dideoxygalactose transaminase
MIHFNIPYISKSEAVEFENLLANKKFCGDGQYTKLCSVLLEKICNVKKVLLTTSCTHALEMAALLLNIMPGDEVIMPSFTFVSTANAFVLRGAKIVFVDIKSNDMNIDESLIESAISPKTKAIVVVHYAGNSCEMDEIMLIADKYKLIVIEDAAQALGSKYKGKSLGSIGHLSAISFHETKNLHCGEGGALLINDNKFIERAEIIREKGTNRSKYIRGQVDKYTWVDIGSSYLLSEINASFLYSQLSHIEIITEKRTLLFDNYIQSKLISPIFQKHCQSNGHIFYLICENVNQRDNLITFLKTKNIFATFHYIPLHTSDFGKINGTFIGLDLNTSNLSNRLIRLPMHYDLTESEQKIIFNEINNFLDDK